MSDTKILQAILDGQQSLKEELKADIKRVEKKVEEVDKKVEANGKIIDALGRQLAVLDDDAPSGKAFRTLEKRVEKLEVKVTSLSSS